METGSISIVEYLSVFTTFVYGYVCTRFFSGWSAMINFRHSIRFSKEHLFWTLLAFGLLIDVWWGSWNKTINLHKHVVLYYYSLVSPLVFYIISIILFPPLSDEKFLDLKAYFHRVEKRNYLAFTGLFISFLFDSIFFSDIPQEDIYYNLGAIALAVGGYFSTSIIFHRLILAAGWAMLITHIGFMPPMEMEKSVIRDFSMTEYLTVFIAFIYGFIASRFFSGWGVMIMRFDRITFSKEHLAWTFLAFVLLIDMWTGSWLRESYISTNINYFILSLALPLGFYILGTVMFPVIRKGEDTDLHVFYLTHKKMIFLFFGIILLVNGITALSMEQELLHIENLFRLIAIILTFSAVTTKQVFVERAILVISWSVMILHVMVQPYIE